MKCKCAECGITKFRFVKGTTGKKVKDYYLVEIVHLIKYQLLKQFYSPARKSLDRINSPFIYMSTYCVKQRKKTQCISGSETYVMTKNGRPAMKCKCAECGITKFRFLSQGEMKGAGFDELIVKGLAAGAKGLFNLGRRGVAKGIKSDFARNKIKSIGHQYLDRLVDDTTDDLSTKIAGAEVDIHKAIGKLPKPKSGWTLPGHKYTGPYNDLEKQVRYDKDTGEILEIYDKPTGKTDAIAMQHDVDYSVCGDDKECKHRADRQMVRALDAVPWRERQWGHWLARNTINAKRKLGLGAGAKKKTPKI